MIKHVGKHDQRRVVLLFKEVPGHDDMCLIVYTDTLPKLIHDPMMKCIESEVGQRANDITGPLSRTLMDTGANLLNTLHTSGHIRKVPTNQMILTPNAQTTIRLDELNKILKEMDTGDEAKQRLAKLDAQAGFKDPDKSLKFGDVSDDPIVKVEPLVASQDSVLTDTNIAQGQLSQANLMEKDAEVLLREAKNLRREAYESVPALKPKAIRKKATSKKVVAKESAITAKRKPGRPKKNVKTPVEN